jgi:hypothetical protein
MAAPTQQFTMHSAFLPYFLSMVLILSPALNIDRDTSACSGFTVVFAEPAVATTIARPIMIRSGKHSEKNNNSTTTYRALGTIFSDSGDREDRSKNGRFVDEKAECNHVSRTSSSPLLCLHPLTARTDFYLRTLYRRQNWGKEEEDNAYYDDDGEKYLKHRYIDYCWESVQDAETNIERGPMQSSSTPVHHTTVASLSSPVRLNNKTDKNGPQSLALKVDLLFATMKVQNNEIHLPRSIAELFRQQKVHPDLNTPEENVTNLPDKRSDSFTFSTTTTTTTTTTTSALPSASSSSSTPSQLHPIIERPSQADIRVVDLAGRWRPSATISSQDLTDYDEFLKACCSDKISYWTRKLLTSSSIVSRQEFVVTQFDEGRILEFVDIHPLSSNVWNRTIVTNGNRFGTNGPEMSREDVNRLKDPQGDPILIEAYWQDNGTVHTSLLRKVDDRNDGDRSANQGWLQTRRYLFSEKNHLETDKEEKKEETKRVMVVETTYHSSLFPTILTEATLNTVPKNKSKSNIKARDEQGEDTATRMIWKWEQVL